ncbi:MAG TPA: hypothetical protein VLM44_12405 [Lutibacter sp.]|nr:hypothetical protein [Lutibacter sp.]
MKKLFQFIISPKVLLILIFIFLAQGLLLKGRFETYRFSDYYDIYEYGIFISKGLVYVAFALSFLFPLIIWSKTKIDFRKNMPLMIVGFMPALYFIVLYTFSN